MGNVAAYNSGTGAVSTSSTPVLIENSVPLASITQRIGTTIVCGLTSTGAAYCIGNLATEFGGAGATLYQTPQRVGGTKTFASLSHMSDNLCGVGTDAALYCWGSNGNGQLGQGAAGPTASTTPLVVLAGHNFSAVDVNDEGSVCAIATDGVGYCWGYNFYGQIGDGTNVNKSSPTAISGSIAFRTP